MDDYNNNDNNIKDNEDAFDTSTEELEEGTDNSNSSNGNGYKGIAASNRDAYARNLVDPERVARNRANLEQARTRRNTNLEDKNLLDKVKDQAGVLSSKRNLLNSQIDKVRSDAFKVMHPVEAAKMAAKRKIWLLILANLSWIIPAIIIIFVVLFVVVIGASANDDGLTSNYQSVHSKYSYCESINVDGTLYSLEDYIAGVVQNEAYTSENQNALMAQAIAARTYALYRTDGCKKTITNSDSAQTFNPNPGEAAKSATRNTAGLVLYYNNDIFSTMYDSFCYNDKDCPDAIINADGTYSVTYTKLPSGEKHTITLSDSSYYNRIVPGGGHAMGMSQLVSYQLAKEGMNYEQILKYFYSNGVEIVNLNSPTSSTPGTEDENSGKGYTSTYTNLKNGKTYFNYKQCAFDVDWLCSVGCGLTSTSIIISGDNQSITPTYLYYNYRVPTGYVSMSTYFSHYLPGKYLKGNGTVANSKEELINHLGNGGTAIFFIQKSKECNIMNGATWTNYQHYFAVLDYNSKNNTVYISNPGAHGDKKNGWISLNEFDCAEVSFLVD